MRRLLRREEGLGLVLVLAFMALAVPTVTAALGLASTLSIDSRVKSNLAREQFSAIGANEIAMQLLDDDDYLDEDTDGDGTPDIWEDNDGDGEPDGDEIIVTLNDEEVIINITPDDPAPMSPGGGDGLVVTKTVLSTNPDPLPAESTDPAYVTYEITVTNTADTPVELRRVFDGLPLDFSYSGPSSLCQGGNCTAIVDPIEDTLQFEEGDPFSDQRVKLTWNIFEIQETILAKDESISIQFTAEFTDLYEGNYCNTAWVEPEGPNTRTNLTALVAVGNPATSVCPGDEVEMTTSVTAELNPDEDPLDPNDDVKVTYTIAVENTGGTDLNIWWIRDKLPPGFKYKFGSVSGTMTSKNPFFLTLFGRQRLNWFFLFPKVSLPSMTTKTLTFEALAPLTEGIYENEIWIFFSEYEDEHATYSWLSSKVVMGENYNISINGEQTAEVWVGDEQANFRLLSITH